MAYEYIRIIHAKQCVSRAHARQHDFITSPVKHAQSCKNRRLQIFACHTLPYSRKKFDSNIKADVFLACFCRMNRISLNSACQCTVMCIKKT